MAETFEFELVFDLPEGDHDPIDLSNAVFEAGFEDALVGTGVAGLLGVELETEGEEAEAVIVETARALIKALPEGTKLREVHPDLVSLADVAGKLNIKRQALQKRTMPHPNRAGLYRIEEIAAALHTAATPEPGGRRPRFNVGAIEKWLRAGVAARIVNAKLTTSELDPLSIQYVPRDRDDDKRAAS